MKYTIQDASQAAIGTFITSLFFVALRTDPGPFIDPLMGFGITVVLGILIYLPLRNSSYRNQIAYPAIVCVIVNIMLVLAFKLATIDQLKGFQFFGSPVIILTWLSIAVAVIFDKRNITSLYTRQYINQYINGKK